MTEITKCPYCGEEILSVAKKCKHCDEWQNEYVSNKKTITKIGKYFRELSVIVTGIAITVSIGLWVNNMNTQKDQKQYLAAIKAELEYNAKEFDRYVKFLQKPVRYAKYIYVNYVFHANDKHFLNKDTLEYYSETDTYNCGYWYTESVTGIFPTNAFEMLKFSGAMRQIKNKELLQSIWSTYVQIEVAKSNLARIFQIKEEGWKRDVQTEVIERRTIDVPMYAFHVTGGPFEMVRYCEQTSEVIKEMLSKFEEAGIK
jgi:hypothetical protein